MQFSLLHKNDSQTKNEAYDLAQMESADDVFYTARDYTQGKLNFLRFWFRKSLMKFDPISVSLFNCKALFHFF